MGFELQENNTKYIKLKELEKNMKLTAIYDGSFTGGKYQSTTHYFKDGEESIGLGGCRDLNQKLELIDKGTMVSLIYRGKHEFDTEKGLATAHSFFVYTIDADGNEIPVILPKKDEAVNTDVAAMEEVADDAESLRA